MRFGLPAKLQLPGYIYLPCDFCYRHTHSNRILLYPFRTTSMRTTAKLYTNANRPKQPGFQPASAIGRGCPPFQSVFFPVRRAVTFFQFVTFRHFSHMIQYGLTFKARTKEV